MDNGGHLPSDAELTPAEAARRYMQRVDVGVRQLLVRLPPEVAAETALLQTALQKRNATGPTCPARSKLRDLHVHLLTSLAASDVRVGKAYALGSALARIADELGVQSVLAATASNRTSIARPRRTAKVSRTYATVAGQRDELVRVHDQVRDLATVLPPHVGQPVRESIARWISYLDGERRTRRTGSERDKLLILQRQVFLWKALLVQEKDAQDSLSADDVLAVTLAALRKLTSYALLTLRTLTGRLPLAILIAGGTAGVAALALAHTGTASTALVTTVGRVVATSWRAGRANTLLLLGELKGRIQGSLEDAAIA